MKIHKIPCDSEFRAYALIIVRPLIMMSAYARNSESQGILCIFI